MGNPKHSDRTMFPVLLFTPQNSRALVWDRVRYSMVRVKLIHMIYEGRVPVQFLPHRKDSLYQTVQSVDVAEGNWIFAVRITWTKEKEGGGDAELIGAFADWRITTISFVMSSRRSFRLSAPKDSAPAGQTFVKFCNGRSTKKTIKKIEVRLKWDKNSQQFTLRPTHIYDYFSHQCYHGCHRLWSTVSMPICLILVYLHETGMIHY